DAVSLSVVDPVRDGRGWAFREGPGYGPDPVNGFTLIREAYDATEPGYDGHISVPVLWDRETSQIVSNNFPDITIDLGTQFGAWARSGADLYPEHLRPEIDALNDVVYATVNDGVYRCGFATSQQAYDTAVAALFATLDELEQRLAGQRYLFGGQITEADVRLWVTLARFDSVYVTHFKANVRRLVDYPNLWAYPPDLSPPPPFGPPPSPAPKLRSPQPAPPPPAPAPDPAADRARRATAGLGTAASPGEPPGLTRWPTAGHRQPEHVISRVRVGQTGQTGCQGNRNS